MRRVIERPGKVAHRSEPLQEFDQVGLSNKGSSRRYPSIGATHLELPHRTDWLFAAGEDDPPHQSTIGHRWRTTVARAGVPPFRLHDLRHSFASGLIAAGCDVVTVQRALGHAKASTTLETYSHLWPSGADRTRRAAATLVDEVLGDSADYLRTRGRN